MRLIPLALVAVLAVACGGDDTESETDGFTATARSAPDTTTADSAGIIDDSAAARTGAATTGAARDPAGAGTAGAGTAGTSAANPDGASASTGSASVGATGGQRQRLYTVQVAAFTEQDSATEWTGRLRSQGLPVWMSLAEVGGQTFYRVRAGAVPTFDEARQLGTIISERYEWPVWIAQLTPADRPPQNAIADTRQLLAD